MAFTASAIGLCLGVLMFSGLHWKAFWVGHRQHCELADDPNLLDLPPELATVLDKACAEFSDVSYAPLSKTRFGSLWYAALAFGCLALLVARALI
jgi:hypothetical protein